MESEVRTRCAIRYPGSKARIAKWIINHFPDHHSYLEPFFGGGSVLFNKPRSNIETVNDLDDDVVNLFQWILKDPERMSKALYMIPYSRTVYETACLTPAPGLNSFDQAVSFLIRLNMSYGFRTNEKKSGWKRDIKGREKAYAAQNWIELPDDILDIAERLRGVQIENRPAVELIRDFNYSNVLIYADPPYMLETRHGRQYACEMNDDDHEELLDVLMKHRGPVLVSGYDSELYRKRLSGWYRDEIDNCTASGAKKREVLWMNFKLGLQMTFDDYPEIQP